MKIMAISLRNRKLQIAVACVVLAVIVAIAVFAGGDSLAKYTSSLLDYTHPVVAATEGEQKPRLAIIIDDFGANTAGVEEMLAIDAKLTCAVIPFCDKSVSQAEAAAAAGKEVILHLSMEPMKGNPSWLGPNSIMVGMNESDVSKIVNSAFEELPMAVGANNHMGSKASADMDVMRVVLNVLKQKDKFFVDSMTSEKHCASAIGKELDINVFERNVFLDGDRSYDQIVSQLKVAASLAVNNGSAIAIGHVGASGGSKTAKAITDTLSYFEEQGIELVFVSEFNN